MTGAELEDKTTEVGGGGGGGGTGVDCSIFNWGCGVGIGGGGGGGDGATAVEAAGDATELSDPGLDATVAGLAEAAVVTFETLPPAMPPLLGHPSSDPSWLGDSAPSFKRNTIKYKQTIRQLRNIQDREEWHFALPSELLSSASGVT